MQDISAFGLVGRCTASNTFPNGFNFSAFSDDADALDSPDFTVADTGMGLNGDMIVWSKPAVIEVGFSIVPTSEDDVNFSTLLTANRVGKGKRGARDVISISVTYPSGMVVNYSVGKIVVGSLLPSVQQIGRIKTRQYRFRFEQVTPINESAQ